MRELGQIKSVLANFSPPLPRMVEARLLSPTRDDMEIAPQLVFALLIVVAALALLVLKIRQLAMSKKAQKWPTVEGTIESGKVEQVGGGGKQQPIFLPVFAFSYQVAGEYYGGRFALLPYTTDPTVADPCFLEHMVGRKVHVNYDPAHPESWFVADELIEGCRVEQKFGRDWVNFAPSDAGPWGDSRS